MEKENSSGASARSDSVTQGWPGQNDGSGCPDRGADERVVKVPAHSRPLQSAAVDTPVQARLGMERGAGGVFVAFDSVKIDGGNGRLLDTSGAPGTNHDEQRAASSEQQCSRCRGCFRSVGDGGDNDNDNDDCLVLPGCAQSAVCVRCSCVNLAARPGCSASHHLTRAKQGTINSPLHFTPSTQSPTTGNVLLALPIDCRPPACCSFTASVCT